MPRFSALQKIMIMKRMKNLSKQERKMMMSIISKKGNGLQLAGQRIRPRQRGSGKIPKRFLRFIKRFPKQAQVIIKSAMKKGSQKGTGFTKAIGVLGLIGATSLATGLALKEYLIRNPSQIAKLGVQAAKFAVSGSGIRLAGQQRGGRHREGGVLNPVGSGRRGLPKKILSFIRHYPKEARIIFQETKKIIKSGQKGSGRLSKALGALGAISGVAALGGLALAKYLISHPREIIAAGMLVAPGPVNPDVLGGGLALAGFRGSGMNGGRGVRVINPLGSGLRLSGQMGKGHNCMISYNLLRPRDNICRKNIMAL